MDSLDELIAVTRKYSHLCQAIESDGTVCNKVKYKKDKYCPMHRARFTRYKSFDLPKKGLEHFLSLIASVTKTCEAIEENGKLCDKKRKERQKYCAMHIWRHAKYGSYDLPKKQIKICKFIGCNNKCLGDHEYCKRCYDFHVLKPKNELKKCKIENCLKKRTGLNSTCRMHRRRISIYGTAEGSGEKRGGGKNWKQIQEYIKKNGPTNKGKYKIDVCIVPDCNVKNSPFTRLTKGLCKKHYGRWQKFGNYNISSKKEYLTKINKKD